MSATKLTKKKDPSRLNYFDITLIVNRDNKVIIIDNPTKDYHDIVDCSTILISSHKIFTTQ